MPAPIPFSEELTPEELDAWAAQGPHDSGSAAVQLAVSTVVLALREDDHGDRGLWLPLVRRLREPYKERFALPGGPLPPELSLEQSASATFRRATGQRPGHIEQLYTFGTLRRGAGREDAGAGTDDVAGSGERVVSVVYWASLPTPFVEEARQHENIRWFPADDLPELAFDHNEIVEYALFRLRRKVEHSRIAHSFLGETFTLAQLREVYEAILGRPLDPANFRRQIGASKSIIDTGRRVEGTRHRPPRLFRYDHTQAYADHGPLDH